MLMHKILQQTILASALLAASVMAQTPYDEGQKALREKSWTEAAAQFKQAIKTDKPNADAAMYWRAHALYQASRNNEALNQIKTLERNHPDSRWIKEAQALKIEHQGVEAIAKSTGNESGMDEDLRIFALSRLMDSDPERALPLVMDTLRNTDSESVRRDALFVLSMSDEPGSQQVIADFARDSKNAETQVTAIHMLGVAGTESSLKLLEDLYVDTESQQVKEAVIHAHVAADQYGNLIRFLKTEKNPQLQREIIHALGALDATEELDELYSSLTNTETRVAVLEAMAMTDNTEGLIKILKLEKDSTLRAAAIHSLSVNGDSEGAKYLLSLYPDGSNTEKKAVIESMMVMDNTQGLISLLNQETDPGLKRLMIELLMVMDSPEAEEYLFELLENKG